MKIITLVENTTTSKKYKKKHGLSFYIETENHKILFDLGSSSLFLENAKKLGINISEIDIVVISHGHVDHGGALKMFLENNSIAKVYIRKTAFNGHYTKVLGIPFYIGLDKNLVDSEQIVFTNDLHILDENILFFSNIKATTLFPTSNKALYTKTGQGLERDNFIHEQSMIIKEQDNSVLFSGCAHNGIVNIQEKAENVISANISHVISGMHLYNPVSKQREKDEFIQNIANYLSEKKSKYYTCHCTGNHAYNILLKKLGDNLSYLSTGSVLTI